MAAASCIPSIPGQPSPPLPLSFLGPGSGLRSRLSGQPRAWAGPATASLRVRGGKRAGRGRQWHRLLVHGCATKGKEAKPGAFQGRDGASGSGAQKGGERKGLEQPGLPRPASPPSAPAAAAGRSPAGRPSPGELLLPRPGSKRLTHVRGREGRNGPGRLRERRPGPARGDAGHSAGLTPFAAGGRPRTAAGSAAVGRGSTRAKAKKTARSS